MGLPDFVIPGLIWENYAGNNKDLLAAFVLDFTTYGSYQIYAKGANRTSEITNASGVVVDNLNGSSDVVFTIGPLVETVSPYTKNTINIFDATVPIIITGVGTKTRVSFFSGKFLGTGVGTNYFASQLAAGLAVETGFISIWGGAAADVPQGYLLCDGSEISRVTFAGLFMKIGTLYGEGNGATTFNLPSLCGGPTSRVPIGAGGTRLLGKYYGSETHQHTMPLGWDNSANLYGWRDASGNPIFGSSVVEAVFNSYSYDFAGNLGLIRLAKTQEAGTIPPSAAVNFVIKT